MIILFLLGLVATILPVSYILNKHLSSQNSLLNGIFATLIVVISHSFLYTLVYLLNLDLSVFWVLFFSISVLLTFLTRNDYKRAFTELKNIKPTGNHYYSVLFWLGIIIFSIIYNYYSERWGTWDAWTVWNLHAKFLMTEGGLANMFAEPVFTSRDYPLFLSSIIALIWNFTGSSNPMVPLIIAYFITLCVPVLAFSAFKTTTNKLFGLGVFFLIIGDYYFIKLGAFQYADILLSLFLLASIILIEQWQMHSKKLLYAIVLGFIASGCGWIKNEGLLVFLIISLFFIISNIKSYKNILAYLAGTIVPITFILAYKNITPQNDFLSQLNMSDIFTRLADFSRYAVVGKYFLTTILLKNYALMLLLVLAIVSIIISKRLKFSINAGIIFVIFSCYFLVYIITKTDLNWNLGTSAQRLLHQILPATMFLMVRTIQKSELKIFSKNK